jgi:hypothetical protein
VAVDVGEPQLRAGVRALLAPDDPHFRRSGGQVEQAGDVRDPRAVPVSPSPPYAGVHASAGTFPIAAGMSPVIVMPAE